MSHRQAKRHRKMVVRTGLGIGLALGASPLALAGDAAPAASPELAEVVVTATRRATSVTDVPYNIKPINISKGEQFQPSFLEISPNNRIPAIVDHDPAGKV